MGAIAGRMQVLVMQFLVMQELAMRFVLAMLLGLLVSGCEQNTPDEPEGIGAWLTLGRTGMASAFVRFDTGETERWNAPFTTTLTGDDRSVEITLQTQRCGAMQFLAVLGSRELKRISHAEAVAQALPCRLNTAQAPRWTLLTELINSQKE
jgi:hypothetical protein